MNLAAIRFLLCVSLLMNSVAFGQRPRERETELRTGTVKEVIQKGKTRTLIVDLGNEEQSFLISPKVILEVNLTGADSNVLQKGAYLEGSGTFTNNRLFLEKAKVRMLGPGAKFPESRTERPMDFEQGQSLNTQLVSGLIMGRQTSKEFPEYEEMMLKPGPNVPVIMFKKDLQVELVSSDIDDVKPEQSIEVEVIEGRNDKLTLVRATVDGGVYVPHEEGKEKKKVK